MKLYIILSSKIVHRIYWSRQGNNRGLKLWAYFKLCKLLIRRRKTLNFHNVCVAFADQTHEGDSNFFFLEFPKNKISRSSLKITHVVVRAYLHPLSLATQR